MASGRYPIIIATVAILGVAAIATAAILHSMWRDAVSDSKVAVGNVASILAEQTSQSVRTIDLVAADIVAHVDAQGIASQDDLHRDFGSVAHYDALVEWLKRLPQVKVIRVVDAAGDAVVSTTGWPTPALNVSGRDPFEHLSNHRDPSLVVGVPLRTNMDGDWTVYFSRRLENGAGDFLGTVSIGVPPDFFLNIAEGTSALQGYRARLLREDGTIYVTNPAEQDQLGVRVVEASEWHALVAAGGGTFRSGARPDAEARFVAVMPVAAYPLVVDVALGEAQVVDAWRERALTIILVSAALALGVAALVASLIVQFQRALERQEQVRDGEERLASESRRREMADVRFETAIGHMRQGIAVFDASSRLSICNTAFLDMYAMTPEEAPPGTPLETILRLRVAKGTYSGDDPEKYVHDRLDLVANPEKPDTTDVQAIKNGRYFRTFKQHLPEGG